MRAVFFGLWIASFSIAAADTLSVAPPPIKQDSPPGPWNARTIETIRGRIVTWDRERCEIEMADGQRQTVASYRVVVAIPDDVHPDQQIWINAWRDQQDTDMIRTLTAAVKTRPPVWRQQWMTAVTTGACFRTKRDSIAYDLIGQLDARPLPPMVVSAIAIDWTSQRADATGAEMARQQLNHDSPLVRLVAASRLIAGNHRTEAIDAMKSLATMRDRPSIMVIARLFVAASVNPNELSRRAEELRMQVDRLPIALQDGPRQMLIERFERSGLNDAAREMRLLWQHAPSLQPSDRDG